MDTQQHYGTSTDLRRGMHANPSFCKQTSNVSSNVQTQRFDTSMMVLHGTSKSISGCGTSALNTGFL